MITEGVDYSDARPDPAALYAAGKRFACRYVSPSAYKNLTAAERDALHAAGLSICLNWENRADDALRGTAGGLADARDARALARRLGFPDSLPIYHSVDFDATAVQLAGPVADYFTAAAAVHGGVRLVGAYGGLRTVRYLLDNALVGWAWQTFAWSGGLWEPRAQLQQYHNGATVAGGDCDLDRAMAADYGQWAPAGPTIGDNMMYLATDGTKYYLCDGMTSRVVPASSLADIGYVWRSQLVTGPAGPEWTQVSGVMVRKGWSEDDFGSLPASNGQPPALLPSSQITFSGTAQVTPVAD